MASGLLKTMGFRERRVQPVEEVLDDGRGGVGMIADRTQAQPLWGKSGHRRLGRVVPAAVATDDHRELCIPGDGRLGSAALEQGTQGHYRLCSLLVEDHHWLWQTHE